MRKLTIVLALLIFSSPAWGEQRAIKRMLELYDASSLKARQELNIKFSDYQYGMSWSSTYLKNIRGEKDLYCPPGKLVITGGTMLSSASCNTII